MESVAEQVIDINPKVVLVIKSMISVGYRMGLCENLYLSKIVVGVDKHDEEMYVRNILPISIKEVRKSRFCSRDGD